jgi:hypothetical protein
LSPARVHPAPASDSTVSATPIAADHECFIRNLLAGFPPGCRRSHAMTTQGAVGACHHHGDGPFRGACRPTPAPYIARPAARVKSEDESTRDWQAEWAWQRPAQAQVQAEVESQDLVEPEFVDAAVSELPVEIDRSALPR